MILKEAPVKLKTDEKTPLSICFVCSGNTCRSPMAAALLNELGKGCYKASSAGLSAMEGDPISENAVAALKDHGIKSTPENDYEHHKARQAQAELLERFDKIIAISRSHLLSLVMSFPELAERMSVMPTDIPDPFMQSKKVYDTCLQRIKDGIKEIFSL